MHAVRESGSDDLMIGHAPQDFIVISKSRASSELAVEDGPRESILYLCLPLFCMFSNSSSPSFSTTFS